MASLSYVHFPIMERAAKFFCSFVLKGEESVSRALLIEPNNLETASPDGASLIAL